MGGERGPEPSLLNLILSLIEGFIGARSGNMVAEANSDYSLTLVPGVAVATMKITQIATFADRITVLPNRPGMKCDPGVRYRAKKDTTVGPSNQLASLSLDSMRLRS